MTAPRAAEQSFYFKVMYWSEIGAAKPLACIVVVTEDDLKEEKSNDVVYEKAVQNALYEGLGKSKGKNMNELQKVLALHDWLVVNCQYDLSYGAKHKNGGADIFLDSERGKDKCIPKNRKSEP